MSASVPSPRQGGQSKSRRLHAAGNKRSALTIYRWRRRRYERSRTGRSGKADSEPHTPAATLFHYPTQAFWLKV